jgi:hypothetical protein
LRSGSGPRPGFYTRKWKKKIAVKKAHIKKTMYSNLSRSSVKEFIRDGGHEQLLSNGGRFKPVLPKDEEADNDRSPKNLVKLV